MDSDQGKLFVGGISWETTEEKLKDYFGAFGDVAETVIMKERSTGRARGFGFVIFTDPAVADRVLLDKHTIDGRQVEAKRAVPRDEQQSVPRSSVGAAQAGLSSSRTKKIFVGGLASTVTEEEFKKYFEQFGTITDVVVMYDHNTQRPRGFGFITFDSEDAVEAVLTKSFHELNEKMVEVKKAIPKDQGGQGSGSLGGGRGGRGGYGGGYAGASGYGGRTGGAYGRETGYGLGRGAYGQGGFTSYGAAGGYGGGYSNSVNGGYGTNSGSFGSSGGFVSPGSYGGSGYAGGTAVPYGSPSGGYGVSGYGSSSAGSGRNSWNLQTGSFGSQSGSAGYSGGSGFASQQTWASVPGGPGGGNAGTGYGSGTYAYGTDGAYYGSGSAGPRNSNYAGSNSTANMYSIPAGGQSVGNFSSYGDVYGTSTYGSDQWGSQSQATTGSGYANTSEAVNGAAGYGGGYGATARQTQRSQDARFQPYPARTGDRSM